MCALHGRIRAGNYQGNQSTVCLLYPARLYVGVHHGKRKGGSTDTDRIYIHTVYRLGMSHRFSVSPKTKHTLQRLQ